MSTWEVATQVATGNQKKELGVYGPATALGACRVTVLVHAPECWVEIERDREAGHVTVLIWNQVDGEQMLRMGGREPASVCELLAPPFAGSTAALRVGGFYLTLADDATLAQVRAELGTALH